MPDYASILERSIETLPEKTPDLRQAVYDRARAALARQLTSVNPPLAPEVIELQHQHLEDAILTVEMDFPQAAAGESEEPKRVAIGWKSDKAGLTGDKKPVGHSAAGGKQTPASGPDDPKRDKTEFPAMAQIEPETSDKRWEQPKASNAPAKIMVLLFVLIAGGAAVFAYTQWEPIQAFVKDLIGEKTVAGTQDTDGVAGDDGAPLETAGGDPADAPKIEDRLLEGIGAPLDGAQATPPVAEAPDATPVVGGAGETMEPAPGQTGGTQIAASETPVTGTPAGTETVDAVPQGLVGQRAIFEEQGAEGAPGKSVAGVVAWSQKTRENGQPSIVGVIELPERNATLSLTITKNTDEALPASHLIEIEFRGAEGLIESPLERVPALFMKKTAQSRGQRLAGEAVPVTENIYWIALSDQGEQVSRNIALLRQGNWFGLPILFKNGRGALINFEKGIPGDQVFEAVLAAWEAPTTGQ